MGLDLGLILRDMTPDDRAFIFSSYLRNFHKSHPIKFCPNTLYFGPQHDVLEEILGRSSCTVACYPEEPSEILAYALYELAGETLLLHYLYVRSRARKQGIAKRILLALRGDAKLCVATHACDNFGTLRHKVPGMRVVYQPYRPRRSA